MEERFWHRFFEIGIVIKGIDGILEFIGGILLLIVSPATINSVAMFFLQGELSEDPKDILANIFLHTAQGVVQMQKFASIILITHGIVKLFLVAGLIRNKLWAYPTSIVIFSGFGLYQIYQLTISYSLFLWVITIIDVIVIGLIIHEYRYMRRRS